MNSTLIQNCYNIGINNYTEFTNEYFLNNKIDEVENNPPEDFSIIKADYILSCMKNLTTINDNEDQFISNKTKYIELKEHNEDLELEELPELYTVNRIKNIITKKICFQNSKNVSPIIFSDIELKNIENSLSQKDNFILGKKKKNKFKIKEESIKHTKYSGDNIIKKIKYKLLEYFLKFVNDVINASLEEQKIIEYNKILRPSKKNYDKFETIIKMIDYTFVDRLNKKLDLLMLNMSFKEIFSKNISPRYSKLNPESNKIIIEKLLQEEKDNFNIIYALNLQFKDWMNVFLYKKEINSLKNFDNDKLKLFTDCFQHLDDMVLNIYNNNKNEKYLIYFLIYLYNYERWFFLKRGRIRNKKRSKNK